MSRAYYNEIDQAAVAILRELIARDVIMPGDIDDRSIKDVRPGDLLGYTQCHFFAGGGLWSVAARLAGWPDSRPLWTGSCPCQPFSAAGKGYGTDDPRHLWPDFHRLISSAGPFVVMGEQVAGAPGYAWFDGVRSDLARESYAARCVDIPACAVDAPHQRNRLYWIASLLSDTGCELWRSGSHFSKDGEIRPDHHGFVQSDTNSSGYARRPEESERIAEERTAAEWFNVGLRTDTNEFELQGQPSTRQQQVTQSYAGALRNGSWWAEGEWFVSPLDNKARRTKPGLPFLVDGLPGRLDLWRVGGNAIIPILAAEVIAAFLDTEAVKC